jgi:hypothetical protein
MDTRRGGNAAPDEERWLFVGKDPYCPPSPKHRDHPGALFDEVEKVIRRSYDVWMGRSEEAAIASLALGLLHRRRSSRQAAMMTIQVMANNGDSRGA